MFSLNSWKERINEQLKELGSKWDMLKSAGANPAYSFLCAAAFYPIVQACQQGDISALVALGQVTAGIGGGLVSNLIQNWKDNERITTEGMASDLAPEVKNGEKLREEIDAILEKLEVIEMAKQNLKSEQKDDFIQTLKEEMKKLGNLERFRYQIFEKSAIASGQDARAAAVIAGQINAPVTINQGDSDKEKKTDLAGSDDPECMKEAYLHVLFSRVRKVPLSGVDRKVITDEEAAQLELSAVYTALMTEQREKDDEIGRSEMSRDEKPARALSALELLNREKELVLTGEGGSGKTTFVNFITQCMIGELLGFEEINLEKLTSPVYEDEEAEEQSWDHGAMLPVMVVLRDFATSALAEEGKQVTGNDLWKHIEAGLGELLSSYVPHLKKHMREKGALVMLDGLDEVPEANRKREQLLSVIKDFVSNFPRCRFLITSRPYAYQKKEWKLEDFSEGKISDFSEKQIYRFIDKWYSHTSVIRGIDSREAAGRANLLKNVIENKTRIRNLASRPLLLTLIASLHAWRGGSLPEKREQLYNDTVDLLISHWEHPKINRTVEGKPLMQHPSFSEWLKVERKSVINLLGRLAYEAHHKQDELAGTADIPEDRVVSGLIGISNNPDVRPRRIIEYISRRAGLLIPRGEGIYSFPHRTFQEYLAAYYLTDQDFPDNISGLVLGDSERWREVALLAGAKAGRGSINNVWSLVEALTANSNEEEITNARGVSALIASQLLLENDLAEDVPRRNIPKLERVREWLLAIIERGALSPLDRVSCGNNLSRIGDTRFNPDILYLSHDKLLGFVKVPAGSFFMGTDEKDIPDLIERFGGPEKWYKYECPIHELEIPRFYISRYPVTCDQFRLFVEMSNYQSSSLSLSHGIGNHPVTGVTWYDALAYCRWLTERLKEREDTPEEIADLINEENWHFTLPSEVQWEKAARGTDKRIFPWGADIDLNCANFADTGIISTNPAGCFPAGSSPYGILDMSGNVWEWTRSLWGKVWDEPEFKYPYDGDDDRENLEAGSDVLRILRGGAYDYSSNLLRCSARYGLSPLGRSDFIGFRLVLSPL